MKILWIFLFVYSCSECFSQERAVSKFKAELSFNKKVYHYKEVMTISLRFVNNDTNDAVINSNCKLEYDILDNLEFKDSNGIVNKLWPRFIANCVGTKITIKKQSKYNVSKIKIVTSKIYCFKHTYYLTEGKYIVTSKFAAISNSFVIKILDEYKE